MSHYVSGLMDGSHAGVTHCVRLMWELMLAAKSFFVVMIINRDSRTAITRGEDPTGEVQEMIQKHLITS